jgi:hypothetical protein
MPYVIVFYLFLSPHSPRQIRRVDALCYNVLPFLISPRSLPRLFFRYPVTEPSMNLPQPTDD